MAGGSAGNQLPGGSTPASSLRSWLEFISSSESLESRQVAHEIILRRPLLARELNELIASPHVKTARLAMEFVGAASCPPVEVADAVRQQVRAVISTAETIDLATGWSGYILYEGLLDLARGVMAAATGLGRAGVDFRAELRAMADACGKRDNDVPRQIQTGCEQIIKYFSEVENQLAASKSK